jgi:membrane protease YdiL (CAAX protease family)
MLASDDMAEAIEPQRAAHWGFWGTLIWGTVILIAFGASQTITVLAVAVWRGAAPWKLSGSELVELLYSTGTSGLVTSIVILVTAGLGGSLVVGVIKLKKGSVLREYLCLKPVSLATIRNWLGLLAALYVIMGFLAFALGHSGSAEFISAIYATANPVWMFWLAMVVGAPLLEEVIFRGFLLKGFAASFMGPSGAVVVTSGLWAALHLQYDAYDMATIFCFGLLFGAARLVTGSLLVPLALHATQNLVVTGVAAILS